MKVLLCGDFDACERAQWLTCLREAAPQCTWLNEQQAMAEPAQVQAAVVANPPPGRLQGLTKLRLIQSLWAGVDRLLADPTLPSQVPLARMVDPAMNTAMAETAQWAVLTLHRHFHTYARQQRSAQWQPLPQRRADELQVLVLGLGQMGCTVAKRLLAMGYRVCGYTLREPAQRVLPNQVFGLDALPQVLAQADIVINLLPLTAHTRGLVDARFLAQCKHGAALVNLARGAHVVDADVLSALASGQLAHAVLDVFQTEPLPAQHPYWQHLAVTVLPHAAAGTDPRSAAQVVATNLRALACGQPLQHLVSRERGY